MICATFAPAQKRRKIGAAYVVGYKMTYTKKY